MRISVCIAAVAVGTALTAAGQPPLPRPRPPELPPRAIVAPETSTCYVELAKIALVRTLPPIVGNDGCGAEDVVRLDGILLADDTRVMLTQPATLRCPMAEQFAHWVRDDLAPLANALGKRLQSIESYDSYVCRPRNYVSQAKVSEHGRANALDVRGFAFSDRSVAVFTDPSVPKSFREAIRASACARFTTVLGPGSDSYHDTHVHLDILQRSGGYRLCQWNIGDDTPGVPLTRPRPASLKK